MSTAPRVEYAEFLKEVRAIVSTASTLEEAQAELLQALTALHERRGSLLNHYVLSMELYLCIPLSNRASPSSHRTPRAPQ